MQHIFCMAKYVGFFFLRKTKCFCSKVDPVYGTETVCFKMKRSRLSGAILKTPLDTKAPQIVKSGFRDKKVLFILYLCFRTMNESSTPASVLQLMEASSSTGLATHQKTLDLFVIVTTVGLLAILFVLGIGANSVLLLAFHRRPALRTTSNRYAIKREY